MIDTVARTIAIKTLNELEDIKKYVEEDMVSLNSMVYKGTVGINGTVETLPMIDVRNGDTYKVCSEGVYESIKAKEGDMFIAVIKNGEFTDVEWTYIPSGDDFNDNIIDGGYYTSSEI